MDGFVFSYQFKRDEDYHSKINNFQDDFIKFLLSNRCSEIRSYIRFTIVFESLLELNTLDDMIRKQFSEKVYYVFWEIKENRSGNPIPLPNCDMSNYNRFNQRVKEIEKEFS